MQKRIMVIVHCTSSHGDLSTNKVYCWYLITFVLCRLCGLPSACISDSLDFL